MIMTTATAHAVTINCNIRVGIKAGFVKVNQVRALSFRQFAVFDSLRDLTSKTIVQQATFVTSAPCRLAHSSPADYLLDEIALFIDMNLSFIRRAEKIVIIAHHLLIRANQHESQIVRLFGIDLMKFEYLLNVVKVYKLVDDTVGIACDIAERGELSRRLVQALNRYDGEQLIERPVIGD